MAKKASKGKSVLKPLKNNTVSIKEGAKKETKVAPKPISTKRKSPPPPPLPKEVTVTIKKEEDEPAPVKNKRTKKEGAKPGDAILSLMIDCHVHCNDAINYERISKHFKLGSTGSNAAQQYEEAWSQLIQQGLIEPANPQVAPYRLTEQGKELFQKSEKLEKFQQLKQAVANPPAGIANNDEYHALLKKNVLNELGADMLTLLASERTWMLTRPEIAGLLGVNRNPPEFNYSLKQLKDLGLVECVTDSTKQKNRLSAKAYVDGRIPDFPVPDPEDIAGFIAAKKAGISTGPDSPSDEHQPTSPSPQPEAPEEANSGSSAAKTEEETNSTPSKTSPDGKDARI